MKLRSTKEVAADLTKDFPAAILRYARDPVAFAMDILRVDPQPWQSEFIQAVSDSRFGKIPQHRFAVRSGTGVGKTAAVSFIILWHLACFPDSKIPVTAPTSPQIKAVLWPELRKAVSKIPEELRPFFPYDVTGDKVDLHQNFAVARTAREGNFESFQGFHAKNILLVADEASGVPDEIYMAGQGVMSSHGAITILIGNPTRATGYFFDAFHGDSHLYWSTRIGCDDPTKVRPEIVNPAYVQQMRDKHGENSYEFKVRVLGEFHLEDAGLVIPRPWIDAAVGRAVERDSDWIVWGVDVSDGRDKTALAKRSGNTLLEKTKAWGGKDVMQSVGIVVDEYYNAPKGQTPDEICVDILGMGTAFAGRLKEALGREPVKITRVNVALTGAAVGDRYVSHRVELWARGREWFESMACNMPDDKQLSAELSSVEWEVKDSNGKWALIDKKALGKSPDCFVAGTMVKMPWGEKDISLLRPGEKVMTPFGARKIIKVWETEAAELTTVRFSNGASLIGKPNHGIFTQNAGFRPMDALLFTDVIETYSSARVLKWLFQRLLFTTGGHIGFKLQAATINPGTKTRMKDYCTGISGQPILEKSHLATTSTTLMAIGQIILSEICSALMGRNTYPTTCSKGWNAQSGQTKMQNGFAPRRSPLGIGTLLQRVLHGIASTEQKPGMAGSQSKSYALCADQLFLPFIKTEQNTALIGAASRLCTSISRMTSGFARTAESLLLPTVIGKRSAAPVFVQTESVQPTKTYNLTLESDNVYYANGILVENCADAFLLTFGGVKGKHKGNFTKDDRYSTMAQGAGYGVGSASYLTQEDKWG